MARTFDEFIAGLPKRRQQQIEKRAHELIAEEFSRLDHGAVPVVNLDSVSKSQGAQMTEQIEYRFLSPRPRSNYRQMFVNGRIRAETLYRETVGPEPLSPEQVAHEYGVPVEAVLEAIDYSIRNKELLDDERARESARIKAAGRDKWPYAPRDFQPDE